MPRYVIDPKRSTVWFEASSSVHPIHIRSDKPEGELNLDAGTGRLVIPVGSLRSGQLMQDVELRRRIQARRYPTIEATLRTFDGTSASGDITFMGNTQPASGTLTVTQADDDVTIAGEAQFDVTDFGFNPPNILGVKIHPQVTVRIELVATAS